MKDTPHTATTYDDSTFYNGPVSCLVYDTAVMTTSRFARHLITFWTQYYSAFFSSLAEAEVMYVDPIKPTSVGWLYLQWLGGGRVKGSRDIMRWISRWMGGGRENQGIGGKECGRGGRPFGGKGRSKTTGQARVGLNYLYYLKGVSYYYQRILVFLLFF